LFYDHIVVGAVPCDCPRWVYDIKRVLQEEEGKHGDLPVQKKKEAFLWFMILKDTIGVQYA